MYGLSGQEVWGMVGRVCSIIIRASPRNFSRVGRGWTFGGGIVDAEVGCIDGDKHPG